MDWEIEYSFDLAGPWEPKGSYQSAPSFEQFEVDFVDAQGGTLPHGHYRMRPVGARNPEWTIYTWGDHGRFERVL